VALVASFLQLFLPSSLTSWIHCGVLGFRQLCGRKSHRRMVQVVSLLVTSPSSDAAPVQLSEQFNSLVLHRSRERRSRRAQWRRERGTGLCSKILDMKCDAYRSLSSKLTMRVCQGLEPRGWSSVGGTYVSVAPNFNLSEYRCRYPVSSTTYSTGSDVGECCCRRLIVWASDESACAKLGKGAEDRIDDQRLFRTTKQLRHGTD
jgi:hypothetical protein